LPPSVRWAACLICHGRARRRRRKTAAKVFAQQALQRAQIPFHDASVVLHRLHNTHAAPCSNAHILQMRKITINTRSIEDVGYFEKAC